MAMLTTVDNPYNPFTQWDDWFAFDERHGHHTPALLARLVISSEELSEGDQAWATDQVIDELVRRNETGMYRKVEQP
jgi:hypothetical protein